MHRTPPTVGGKPSTTFLFDGLDVLYEKDSTGQQRFFINALGRHIARVDVLGTSMETFFFHTDYLGSVRMVSDVTGVVVWSERFAPFGDEEQKSGTLPNTHRFTGKSYDEDADLYYFNARWYDADAGRFISEDPLWGNIRDPQSLNRYAYGRNNPYRYVDPTGEEFEGDYNSETDSWEVNNQVSFSLEVPTGFEDYGIDSTGDYGDSGDDVESAEIEEKTVDALNEGRKTKDEKPEINFLTAYFKLELRLEPFAVAGGFISSGLAHFIAIPFAPPLAPYLAVVGTALIYQGLDFFFDQYPQLGIDLNPVLDFSPKH